MTIGPEGKGGRGWTPLQDPAYVLALEEAHSMRLSPEREKETSNKFSKAKLEKEKKGSSKRGC